jgi:hypothetical protein
MRLAAIWLSLPKALPEAFRASTVARAYFIRAKFFQKFCRLSVPPKSVVKLVGGLMVLLGFEPVMTALLEPQ